MPNTNASFAGYQAGQARYYERVANCYNSRELGLALITKKRANYHWFEAFLFTLEWLREEKVL